MIIESSIVSLEGNGTRPSHIGIGCHVGGAMYTLNHTEVHCVAYQTESTEDEQETQTSNGF